MPAQSNRLRRVAYLTFFLSGISAISSGIIVSLLQDKYAFSYGMTGTLLSFMSVGNMAAAFLAGMLPARIGMRATVLVMTTGYFLGYTLTTLTGTPGLLIAAFLMIGLAKGCALNADSVLVGQNSENRAKSMQIMHSCYAAGALLCPFLISFLSGIHINAPMIGVGLVGAVMWAVYLAGRLPGKTRPTTTSTPNTRDSASGTSQNKSEPAQTAGAGERPANTRYAFLRSTTFWLLTALIFCQNAAETSVTGWLVTYYKNQEILTGTLAGYTMTVMWGATLIARLLIAFVFPIRNTYKALAFMGAACTAIYAVLVFMHAPLAAITTLFLFSFSMAGVNPMGTASAGKALTSEGMGILLPVGGIGAIVFPLLIGLVADHASLQAGMLMDLIPCCGILVLSIILMRRQRTA